MLRDKLSQIIKLKNRPLKALLLSSFLSGRSEKKEFNQEYMPQSKKDKKTYRKLLDAYKGNNPIEQIKILRAAKASGKISKNSMFFMDPDGQILRAFCAGPEIERIKKMPGWIA